MNMDYKWINTRDDYSIKTKIGNQTLEMGLQQNYVENTNTVYFNIYIALYHKRKQKNSNEDSFKITGQNPMKTFAAASQMLKILETRALVDFNYDTNVVFYCYGLDNRRKQIYQKFMKRYGYTLCHIDKTVEHIEVIAKKYQVGEYIE